MAKRNPIERARDLAVRFKRIKAAIMVTDQLVDSYFARRGDEIEAFNEELAPMLAGPEAEADAAKAN